MEKLKKIYADKPVLNGCGKPCYSQTTLFLSLSIPESYAGKTSLHTLMQLCLLFSSNMGTLNKSQLFSRSGQTHSGFKEKKAYWSPRVQLAPKRLEHRINPDASQCPVFMSMGFGTGNILLDQPSRDLGNSLFTCSDFREQGSYTSLPFWT